jgi:quercetin dioxygenase-like cupin family protein
MFSETKVGVIVIGVKERAVDSGAQAIHYRWKDQPFEPMKGTVTRRIITSERIMMGEIRFKKGDTVPRHAHDNEQFTYVVEGALKFCFGDDDRQEIVVAAGEVVVIPSNLPHRAEALHDTVEFDIFNPPRQDWLDKTDTYFRD